MVIRCEYCEQDIFDHDPVFVAEFESGLRERGTHFCNYACLAAFIDAEGLTEDNACRVDLS